MITKAQALACLSLTCRYSNPSFNFPSVLLDSESTVSEVQQVLNDVLSSDADFTRLRGSHGYHRLGCDVFIKFSSVGEHFVPIALETELADLNAAERLARLKAFFKPLSSRPTENDLDFRARLNSGKLCVTVGAVLLRGEIASGWRRTTSVAVRARQSHSRRARRRARREEL